MANGNQAETAAAIRAARQLDPAPRPLDASVPAAGFGLLPGVLPPSSPITSQSAADITKEQAGLSREQVAERLARERGLETQVDPLIARYGDPSRIPKMGFGEGYDYGQHGIFRNILQALGTVGAATLPGQAVQGAVYGPGIRRYESEQGALAKQIAAIRGQEEAATAPMRPLGAMVMQTGRGLGAAEAGDAAITNAQTNAANIASQVRTRLEQVAQGWERLSQSDRMTTLREVLGPLELEVKRQMAANPQRVAEIHAAAMLSAANVLSQSKVIQEHGVMADIEAWGRGLLLPIAPQAPGGQQPTGAVVPPSPAAVKGAQGRAKAGRVQVKDPRGIVHTFPDQKSADAFKKAAGIP